MQETKFQKTKARFSIVEKQTHAHLANKSGTLLSMVIFQLMQFMHMTFGSNHTDGDDDQGSEKISQTIH